MADHLGRIFGGDKCTIGGLNIGARDGAANGQPNNKVNVAQLGCHQIYPSCYIQNQNNLMVSPVGPAEVTRLINQMFGGQGGGDGAQDGDGADGGGGAGQAVGQAAAAAAGAPPVNVPGGVAVAPVGGGQAGNVSIQIGPVTRGKAARKRCAVLAEGSKKKKAKV